MSTEVEHTNNDEEKEIDRIEWRRSKVQELSSQGYSQRDIAQVLHVSNGTVDRDLSILREQAKANIKRYIDQRLPEEYEKCLIGLTAITREPWNTSQQTEDKREKIQALSLAEECYSMELDLLTNATVVDDAIRFVSSNNSNMTSASSERRVAVVTGSSKGIGKAIAMEFANAGYSVVINATNEEGLKQAAEDISNSIKDLGTIVSIPSNP